MKTKTVLVTKKLAEAAFKCLDCQKVFLSNVHLQKHAFRRHGHLSAGIGTSSENELKEAIVNLENMLRGLEGKIHSIPKERFFCDRGVSTESPYKMERNIGAFPVNTCDIRKSISLFTLPQQKHLVANDLDNLLQQPRDTIGLTSCLQDPKSIKEGLGVDLPDIAKGSESEAELNMGKMSGIGDGFNKIAIEDKSTNQTNLEPLLLNVIEKLDNLCTDVKTVTTSFCQTVEQPNYQEIAKYDENLPEVPLQSKIVQFQTENSSESSISEVITRSTERTESEKIDEAVEMVDKQNSISEDSSVASSCGNLQPDYVIHYSNARSVKVKSRVERDESSESQTVLTDPIQYSDEERPEGQNYSDENVKIPTANDLAPEAQNNFAETRKHLLNILDDYVTEFVKGNSDAKPQLVANLDSLCHVANESEINSGKQLGRVREIYFPPSNKEDDDLEVRSNGEGSPLKPIQTICIHGRNNLSHSPGLVLDNRIVCKDQDENSEDSSSYNKFMAKFTDDRTIDQQRIPSDEPSTPPTVEAVRSPEIVHDKRVTLNQDEYAVLVKHETSELQQLIDDLTLDLQKWKKAKTKKLSTTIRLKLEERLTSNLSLLGIDDNSRRLSDSYATSIKFILENRRSKSSKRTPTYFNAVKAAFVKEIDRIAKSRNDYPS